MYWGQWNTTHDPRDIHELGHVIAKLFSLSGIRHTWDISPLGKTLMDEDFVAFVAFVAFVDNILNANSV
jgi:hypothetical protein